MPTGRKLQMDICIGGEKVPEYIKDGITYVESNLFTPASYQCEMREYVDGEVECQEWPVTPYTIKIKLLEGEGWAYVYVDGQEVENMLLRAGEEKEIKGFNDGLAVKEFLFALPRFPRCENDRLKGCLEAKVGKILVVLKEARFTKIEYKAASGSHSSINYTQANKKDCKRITNDKYTMATTRIGKIVETKPYPYSNPNKKQSRSMYSLGAEIESVSVVYHMGHTLQEMGFTLKPLKTLALLPIATPLPSTPLLPPLTPLLAIKNGPV